MTWRDLYVTFDRSVACNHSFDAEKRNKSHGTGFEGMGVRACHMSGQVGSPSYDVTTKSELNSFYLMGALVLLYSLPSSLGVSN